MPVCRWSSTAVRASTGSIGTKPSDCAFSEYRTREMATTRLALLNQMRFGSITSAISAANSESSRSSPGSGMRGRPSRSFWPSFHTRCSRQYSSTMPDCCDSNHSTTSLMVRSAQCACRHLNPGGSDAKMAVSVPIPSFCLEWS